MQGEHEMNSWIVACAFRDFVIRTTLPLTLDEAKTAMDAHEASGRVAWLEPCSPNAGIELRQQGEEHNRGFR